MIIKFIGGPLDGKSTEVEPTRTYRWEDGDYGSCLYYRLGKSDFYLHESEDMASLSIYKFIQEFVPL